MPSEQDLLLADRALSAGILTPADLDEATRTQVAAEAVGIRRSLSDLLLERRLLSLAQLEGLVGASSPPPGADRAAPERVGPYAIRSVLGAGGMGVVFRAARDGGGEVALKILSPDLAARPEALKRFLREAEAAGRLSDPRVVRVLDQGEADGRHFIAMELIEGETLEARLKREPVVPEREALRIAREVALALDHANARGLVHRDVKPSNVLLAADGAVKLADFGLAKDLEATSITLSGASLGTPHYVSPEQARGDRALDIRSDIYSLGATLYRMVTGDVPFPGTLAAVILAKHLSERPPSPRAKNPAVSEACCRILERMLARDPDDRYPEPAAVVRDLGLVLAGRPPQALPLPDARGAFRPARSRWLRLRLAGASDVLGILDRMLAKNPADRYPDLASAARDLAMALAGRTPQAVLRPAGGASVPSYSRRLLLGLAGAAVVLALAVSAYFLRGRPATADLAPPAAESAAVAPPHGQNIAHLAKVSVSATGGCYNGVCPAPEGVNDGSPESPGRFWSGASGASAGWVRLDLDKAYRLSMIRVFSQQWPVKVYGNEEGRTGIKYRVSVSPDATQWFEVRPAAFALGNVGAAGWAREDVVFPPRPVRHVRVEIADSQGPPGHIWRTGILEIEAGDRELRVHPWVERARAETDIRVPSPPPAVGSPPAGVPRMPDAGRIAFSSDRDGNREIYMMDPDGANLARLTTLPGADDIPRFRPDGARIAFMSDRDGNEEIYAMDADGANPRRLTNNPARDTYPAFSPDGTRIAFVSDRDGNEEIYVMDADGANPQRLTAGPEADNDPSFDPDGTRIAFRSGTGPDSDIHQDWDIFEIGIDGKRLARLTTTPGNDWCPSFSPDRRSIVFGSFRDRRNAIYRMDADGSDPRRLTYLGTGYGHPAFSPDGARIAFVGEENGSHRIFVMDADGSNPRRLTTGPPGRDGYPSWARRGQGGAGATAPPRTWR